MDKREQWETSHRRFGVIPVNIVEQEMASTAPPVVLSESWNGILETDKSGPLISEDDPD
jgi:hypothetical protein